MANLRIAVAVRNDMLQAFVDRINAGAGPGTLKLYTGVQPANGDTALSGNTLLATLTFADPAEDTISGGVLTFDSMVQDDDADGDGTPTWGRVQDSDGNNVFDGDVGDADSDAMIKIDTLPLHAGGSVRATSGTITLPANIDF